MKDGKARCLFFLVSCSIILLIIAVPAKIRIEQNYIVQQSTNDSSDTEIVSIVGEIQYHRIHFDNKTLCRFSGVVSFTEKQFDLTIPISSYYPKGDFHFYLFGSKNGGDIAETLSADDGVLWGTILEDSGDIVLSYFRNNEQKSIYLHLEEN
jgi:hypothetical protein